MLALLAAGVGGLAAFAAVERRVAEPIFRLPLFRIRAFTFGTASTFLSAVARGGLMLMLDHLAAGDLAAPARLRLHRDAAVRGGHYLHSDTAATASGAAPASAAPAPAPAPPGSHATRC